MTYGELKKFVTEALGEDIASVDQIISGVRAGFGDLIARGYREFTFEFFTPLENPTTLFEELMTIRKTETAPKTFQNLGYGMAVLEFPADCLTILYVKAFFTNKSELAVKLALNNPAIQSTPIETAFRTRFNNLGYEVPPQVIYYKKGKNLFVEWNIQKIDTELIEIEIGYYKNLPLISESTIRKNLNITATAQLDIEDVVIPIADDYCNVLVNFMIWYVAASSGREQEQLTVLKNEYKYSVEDLLARKSKEDQYDETMTISTIEN